MKKIDVLVLGAGYYQIPVFKGIANMGLTTLAVDKNPSSPGFKCSDEYANLDITDVDGVVKLIQKYNPKVVLPLNDIGVVTAHKSNVKTGLINSLSEGSDLVTEKIAMRERWLIEGIESPIFREISSLQDCVDNISDVGLPSIIKPSFSGGGGRGISIVENMEDLEWAYHFASKYALDGRIIMEEFVDGTELTVETITYEGTTSVLTMSDKYKPESRYRVAKSLNYPASISDNDHIGVTDLVIRAVDSLGIVNGPAHSEVILTSKGPVMVETGARGGGGHIFSLIVKSVTGIDYVRESVQTLRGYPPDLSSNLNKGCVYRFFTPSPGELKSINGLEDASKMPGVLEIGVHKKIGDTINILENSLERAGYAVVVGEDILQAKKRADDLERTVDFETI